jgi:hypothetical protein
VHQDPNELFHDPGITDMQKNGAMDVAPSLQKVIFAVAESQSLDAVLHMIVRGLAERPEVALARIWLTAPGDICAACHMRSICPAPIKAAVFT